LSNPGANSTGVAWDTVTGTGTDVVVVAPCGFGLDGAAEQAIGLLNDARVPAGAEVWAVDADAFVVRPGPRLVDGVETFASILHPELTGPPDPTRARRLA
jgi:iron complex transport system substrate-binding protein